MTIQIYHLVSHEIYAEYYILGVQIKCRSTQRWSIVIDRPLVGAKP